MIMTGNTACMQNVQAKTKRPTVFRLMNSVGTSSIYTNEMTATGTISAFGVEKNISIQILQRSARLSDLIPLAWALCDAMVLEAKDHSRVGGKRTCCQKECSACCSYLVPLSIPEVIHLYDEIQSLPSEQSGEFWGCSLSVARHLLENGSSGVPDSESTLDDVGKWYSDKQATCPFLKNDLCAIYDQRPMACREYWVTTPALQCRPETVGSVETLELPYSVLESLGEVAAQLEGTPVEAVMLPLVLPWIRENRERASRKWSALKMAQCFLYALGK